VPSVCPGSALSSIAAFHKAQLKTYRVLSGCSAGLLINFNLPVLKQGLARALNTK
jgi:PD-(D/E)XK nuclease superfamily protein